MSTVAVLLVLLAIEAATGICLAGLSLVTAVVFWFNRGNGGFADLGAVVTVMLALVALIGGLLAGLAWFALKGRRAVAVPLSLTVHGYPLLIVLLTLIVRPPSPPAIVAALAWAVVGAALTLAPATRAAVTR